MRRTDEWESTPQAMLERLSPCGRSIVLAFSYGMRASRRGRDAVAVVVMHRMVFRTGISERELSVLTGLSRKGVRSACLGFAAAMRRCIGVEGLSASDVFAPRRDDPEESGGVE